jgi:hypothetical protein
MWSDSLAGTSYSFGQRFKSSEANQILLALRRYDAVFEKLSTRLQTYKIVDNATSNANNTPVSAAVYDPYLGYALAFYKDVGTSLPGVFVTAPGADFWSGTGGSAGVMHASEQLRPRCAAVDGNGLIVVGGTPAASSANKYLYTNPTRAVTASWLLGTSSQTSTAGAVAMLYESAASKFVAGLSDGKVERSSDGITWSASTVPNANAITAIASNGSGRMVAVSSASTNKCIYSTDSGATWAEATLISTAARTGVCWSPGHQKFFALTASALESSVDGVSWSSVASFGGSWGIASSGNQLIIGGNNISLSTDGGVTKFSPQALYSPSNTTYGGVIWAYGVLIHYSDDVANGFIATSLPVWY